MLPNIFRDCYNHQFLELQQHWESVLEDVEMQISQADIIFLCEKFPVKRKV